MNILVIGGTGLISREITRQLADRNDRISIVNRGQSSASIPGKVEVLYQDRHAREDFSSLFHDRSFDAVIDMISFNTEDARQTVELFHKRTAQIMIVSSVAAYKRPLRSIPTREAEAELWESREYRYGFEKAEMERYLFEQIKDGIPITIIRPSLTFGKGSRNIGVLRQNIGILDRIRRGKKLIMFGDGTNPWSFTFSRDLARMMIALIGNKDAIGEAFHLANQERSNWLDLYLEFGQIVGKEPNVLFVPSRVLYEADPGIFEHIYFEKSHPGLFDNEKYRHVTGDTEACTGLSEGLRGVVRSWEAEGLRPVAALNDLEDSIISHLEKTYSQLRNFSHY